MRYGDILAPLTHPIQVLMRSTITKWLFIVYLLGSGTLYSIVILLLFPFVGRAGRYWLAKQWCRALVFVMRWLPGVSCSIEGLEHLPDGPAIILCRHESTWETLAFLALIPRRISFVFKEDLLRIPFFGWVLRGLDMVSLNRGSARQAHQAVTKESAERLAKGDVVVIFPEGTRVLHDAPLRMTSGGVRLACATGVPAVPVVLNAGKVWPTKGWPDRRGHIRVVIGPPLSPREMTQQELSHAVHDWMKNELERL
ncbi:1-acyl-sn-glycerol-3-phosphate acyltransferase [Burkholderia sp. WP9]|nr:1-acyl-sn-glycerol-3-phosphate acyltransferase [Burkholderia sp. WP9]